MSIGSIIGSVIGGVGKVIDDLHTSEEEREEAKARLAVVNQRATLAALELDKAALANERALFEAQAATIQADAQGESGLQRSWRPILMLAFGALVIVDFLGLTGSDVTQESRDWLFRIVAVSVGGYIGGRTVEKVVKTRHG